MNLTRNGKITRLPLNVRENLNRAAISSSLPQHPRAEDHQHAAEDAGERLVAEVSHEVAAIPRGDGGGGDECRLMIDD